MRKDCRIIPGLEQFMSGCLHEFAANWRSLDAELHFKANEDWVENHHLKEGTRGQCFMTHGISSKQADVPQFTQNPTGNPPNLDHVLNYSLGHPTKEKKPSKPGCLTTFSTRSPCQKAPIKTRMTWAWRKEIAKCCKSNEVFWNVLRFSQLSHRACGSCCCTNTRILDVGKALPGKLAIHSGLGSRNHAFDLGLARWRLDVTTTNPNFYIALSRGNRIKVARIAPQKYYINKSCPSTFPKRQANGAGRPETGWSTHLWAQNLGKRPQLERTHVHITAITASYPCWQAADTSWRERSFFVKVLKIFACTKLAPTWPINSPTKAVKILSTTD